MTTVTKVCSSFLATALMADQAQAQLVSGPYLLLDENVKI